MKIRVISEDIYADGVLVGMLVRSPESHMIQEDFTRLVDGTMLDEIEKEKAELNKAIDSSVVEDYGATLDEFMVSLKPFVRGGLVRIESITQIVEQLKQEAGLE